MRKITSILLLCLLLFNCGGYRLLFYWMQQQTTLALETKLNNNKFAEPELLEIVIPLHMPYQSDWSDFQPANGEIVVKGIIYQLVKKKVVNNRLVIKCIPNFDKGSIAKSQDSFFKLVNDFQQSKPVKKSADGAGKGAFSFSEYCAPSNHEFPFHRFQNSGKFFPSYMAHQIQTKANNTPAQPPEIMRA